MLTRTKRAIIPAGLPLALCALAVLFAPAARAADHPLQTGLFDSDSFYADKADADLSFQRVRDVGANWVRIWVPWSSIAPDKRPRSWRPRDPSDRDYSWSSLDDAVTEADDRGLEPLLLVFGSPSWARNYPDCDEGPICAPDPDDFADFSHAVSRRFNGSFGDLPRVRYWQAWNEANIHPFFLPQYDQFGDPLSPDAYRVLLNDFSDAVKDERSDNLVVTSGLAPVERPGSVAPMTFMRDLLCMTGRTNPHPKPGCDETARFDIWSTHPYTPGSPTRPSVGRDDATLADLPEMSQLLRAAYRAGHIDSDMSPPPFWVTEFSWDSDGPDPGGVPLRTHARWTAEALYRMWRAGVSNVFWFLLRDQPGDGAPPLIFQSGLYFRGSDYRFDRPKPAARAFHFPFVAIPGRGRVRIWGRTPDSEPGTVAIQVKAPGGWLTVRRMVADSYGIFTRATDIRTHGWARAVYDGRVSVPYQIERTPPVFQRPFGRL